MLWAGAGAVAIGGAIGSVARYLAIATIKSRWPDSTFQATFAVNIVGSFLIGIALAKVLPKQQAVLAAFLLTGCLGGFTTFSAFSADNLALLRSNQWSLLLFNSVGQSLIGLIAAAAGLACAGGIPAEG